MNSENSNHNGASIEITNAKEEISEIIELCNYCGLCKEIDPVFRVLREEALTARGRAILFSKGIFDRSVFDFSLCGQCKIKCPFGIDIDEAVRRARKIVNLRNREHPENKKMLDKILNRQNPFYE